MQTGVKIMDTMTKNPIVCKPNDSIIYCAGLMTTHEIGSLIVIENGTVKGIVTEQDFTRKVVANNMDVNQSIDSIMEKNVISLPPDKDIEDAVIVMADNNIKHLPIIDKKGKLVGFLTSKDVLKIQPELIELLIERIRMNNGNYNIRNEYNREYH
ncbi:MAG: CBS domain-containing protein [Nitrospiraceae bacterium]|nr:CBS domain-containing protein [Nitrospiraceae bacterium]